MTKKSVLISLLSLLIIIAVSLFISSCADKNEDGASSDGVTETIKEIDPNIPFDSITDDTERAPETETAPPAIETEAPEPVTEYTPQTEAPAPQTEAPTPVTEYTPPVTTPPAEGALAGCLFIGDSRTVGLDMVGVLTGADIFATVGMSVFGVTSTIADVKVIGEVYLSQLISMRQYSKVYILLGINEIGSSFDMISAKFSELISYLQSNIPGVKIIIEANLHVTTSRSQSDATFNNANINALNEKLKALTNGSTVFWLDANTILDDSSGGLAEANSGGDGIHLEWNCYTTWGQWIAAQNSNY